MMTDANASVVLATAHTLKTLVDGTCRITVDVEPLYRAQAMELFGEPGSAMALARLTQESEAERLQDEAGKALAKDGRPKHSAAVIAAFQLPHDSEFQKYLAPQHPSEVNAVITIKRHLGIAHRHEIDTNPKAAAKWATLRTEYAAWLCARRT